MKLLGVVFQSLSVGISRQLQCPHMFRALSTNSAFGGGGNNNQNIGPVEPEDDFQRRIFSGHPKDPSHSLFQAFDKIKMTRRSSGVGSSFGGASGSEKLDLHDEIDGMDGKLKKAAQYFEFNLDEIEEDEDFSFRPDMNFSPGMTYEPKDLNLRKPGVWKPSKQNEFEVTTEEVLKKADFRNVRFLANFLTDAGIIIKRSKTGISAKAQRKVAREIKTARAFGLLPFTTMGTKAFVVGRTMENLDTDYEYTNYGSPAMANNDPNQEPIGE